MNREKFIEYILNNGFVYFSSYYRSENVVCFPYTTHYFLKYKEIICTKHYDDLYLIKKEIRSIKLKKILR